MALEDEKIIELYWERSENAIAETDKKYRERCLYVARSILNDNSDAEECLNDTYLTAWNLMPPERPKILSSFLFRIIRNHSLNRLRFLNSSKRKRDLSFSINELGECVDGKNDTEEKFVLLGDSELTEEQKSAADIDGDGVVTLADLARLQQYLSKKVDSLR